MPDKSSNININNITQISKSTLLVLTISLIDIWHRNKQSTFFSSKNDKVKVNVFSYVQACIFIYIVNKAID